MQTTPDANQDRPAAPGEVQGFTKSRTERIHAALYRYQGQWRIDLRTFYLSRNEGAYRRTKRGVSVPHGLLPELEAAIAKLREAADSLAEPPSGEDALGGAGIGGD